MLYFLLSVFFIAFAEFEPAQENALPIPVEQLQEIGPKSVFEADDEAYARANDVVHLMHDPLAQEYVDETSEDEFVAEWDEHMDDFQPDMLVTFKLKGHSDEFFYQEVGPEPTLIRGGYFTALDKDATPLKFDIIDPQGNPIIQRLRPESLFHFVTESPGIYTLALHNPNRYTDSFVTLVVGAGNETSLRSEQLRSVEDNMFAVTRMVQEIVTESTYLWGRQKSHIRAVARSANRVIWLSGLELATIGLTVVIQVFLMKNLVSGNSFL